MKSYLDMKEDYYKQLEGFTIKKYLGTTTEEDIEGFPQFLATNGKEDILLEVSRDPEGNGGGFMFISNWNGGK